MRDLENPEIMEEWTSRVKVEDAQIGKCRMEADDNGPILLYD